MCLGELISALNCRAWIDPGGRIFIKKCTEIAGDSVIPTKVLCGTLIIQMGCFLQGHNYFLLEVRSASASASVYRIKTLSLQQQEKCMSLRCSKVSSGMASPL